MVTCQKSLFHALRDGDQVGFGDVIGISHVKRKPLIAYEAECVAAAKTFLKGLSDDTEDSVPAAYNLLRMARLAPSG